MKVAGFSEGDQAAENPPSSFQSLVKRPLPRCWQLHRYFDLSY